MRYSLFLIAAFFSLSLISFTSHAQVPADDIATSLQKLNRLFSTLDAHYVDGYNSKKATEDAIRAILKELDPHSNYLTAEELKVSNENLQGSFEGVGITYDNDSDTLLIISTIDNGPADRAGICPGDKIIYVGDSLIAGISISSDRISKLLRGKKGSEVIIKVLREDENDLVTFALKRDKIPIESVTASYMINAEIGYIKVVRFGSQTVADLKDRIKKLKKQGMQHLILDLRGNPGGYLHAAVEMVDEFIGKDELVLYTQGKESKRKDYFTKGGGSFEDGRLAVLIDEGSASASEIVSGAIQDLDRGIVIGRRSFGKGLVQNTYPLGDGSVARITTARYYTPTGRSIQRPYNQGKDKYYEDLKKRFERGELTSSDNIHLPDSLKYLTKGGRTVYGGGGIMPDIFVPMDSLSKDSLVKKLHEKNIFYRYAVRYISKHRKEFVRNYGTPEIFRKNFVMDNNIFGEFAMFCNEKGFQADLSNMNMDILKYTDTLIKAYIADIVWDQSAYIAIYNERDQTIKIAIEAIEKDKLKEMVMAK